MRQMKDSGVKWIGEVPEGWEIYRLKNIGSLYGGLTGKSGDDFSVEDTDRYGFYVPFTNIFNNTIVNPDTLGKVKISIGESQNEVGKGDILLLMSSEDKDGIGKSALYDANLPFPVYLNSFCKGLKIKRNACPSFFNYVLNSDAGHIHNELFSNGFTRVNLRQDNLMICPIPFPCLQEQEAIASYLDKKCGEIDSLVGLQEEMIAELKAYKQSVITEAVTKGLDPDAKMKDSGVEWIGEVPMNWAMLRFKYAGSYTKGKLPATIDENDGMPIIGASEMLGGSFRSYSTDMTIPQCKETDILILWDGANAGITSSKHVGIVASTVVKYTITDNRIYNEYLAFLFKAAECFFKEKVNGTTIPHMNTAYIEELPLLLPPLPEQHRIATYLDTKTSEIDQLIAIKQQKITELKEYKKSLIYECVTGKKEILQTTN